MKLLLDAGNSRLKWAMVHGGEVLHRDIVTPDEDGLSQLVETVGARGTPDRVAVACVRDDTFRNMLEAWCTRQNWPVPFWIRVSSGAHGVRPAYPEPSSLGVDRYAAMVAARGLYTGPLIVVDCGTAVTLDVVDAGGQHLGGLIMPGLALMRRALVQGTAALPARVSGHVHLLSDNTADAVTGGTALGLALAIDGLCGRIAHELGTIPVHVLTGGDGPVISALSALDYEQCPWLVLRGVHVITEEGACEPWC